MEAPRDIRLKLELLSKEIEGRDRSHRLLAADVARLEQVARQAHTRLDLEVARLTQALEDRDIVIQELTEHVRVLSGRLDKAAEWAKQRNGHGGSKDVGTQTPNK